MSDTTKAFAIIHCVFGTLAVSQGFDREDAVAWLREHHYQSPTDEWFETCKVGNYTGVSADTQYAGGYLGSALVLHEWEEGG